MTSLGIHHSIRSLSAGYWVVFLIIQVGAPAFAAAPIGLSDVQFTLFSSRDIDVRLDGRGGNKSNRYGTFSPNMKLAPNGLRGVILGHERRKPTQYTVNAQALARCTFISTGLELDNIKLTQEWLITTQDGCTPVAPFGLKTFWLVQRVGSNFNVKMAERGQKRVFISKQVGASGYRPLSLQIRNGLVSVKTAQGAREYKAKCKKSWGGQGNQYIGQKESIEVWAIDPVTNSKAWLGISHAFQGSSIALPTACLRY